MSKYTQLSTLKTIKSNFLRELQDAYAGKKTSLPFIKHVLSSSPIVKNGEIFQVFVIGGSAAKTATLRKNGNDIKILKTKQNQVNFKTEEDLLSFVENKTEKDINVIALNFAYPMTPVFENGRLDGELLAISKEGTFHGLIGKKIGQEIENYIFKKRKNKIVVSLANDTICLLLSGLVRYKSNSLAAGIVGTGLNFAIFLNRNSLVNLESAGFDKFTQSQEGITIDRQSLLPGRALFEKETAGAYLYKHFNIIIKNMKIDFSPISSTEELNRISLNLDYSSSEVPQSGTKSRSLKDESSRQARTITNPKISQTARSLLKRSAQLVACQIAGIAEFKKQDMVFNMEGSLFWKGNGYKEMVEKTVKQLIPKYNVSFVEIKDSGILGTAKLIS